MKKNNNMAMRDTRDDPELPGLLVINRIIIMLSSVSLYDGKNNVWAVKL